MKLMKKVVAFVLAMVMAAGLLPVISATAADEAVKNPNDVRYALPAPEIFERYAEDDTGRKLKYLVQMPRIIGFEGALKGSEKKYPVIVSLHGGGGHEAIDKYISGELKGILVSNVDRFAQFNNIVIAPRFPTDAAGKGIASDWIDWEDLIMKALDQTIEEFSVDTDRVFLIGYSMGGAGTWEIGKKYPERFAALAPASGFPTLEGLEKLKYTPIWAFHGASDATVPFELTKNAVDRLREIGGNVNFNIYNGGHKLESFTFSYTIFNWLALQSLPNNAIQKEKVIKQEQELKERLEKAPSAVSVKGKPIVDGEIEKIWNSVEAMKTETAMKGTDTAYAYFKTLWDDQYLYVLAHVYDSSLSGEAVPNDACDSLDIYINFGHRAQMFYGMDARQYHVDIRGNVSMSPRFVKKENIISKVKQVQGGYIVEAAIPVSGNNSMDAGKEMGLDIAVNDEMGNAKIDGICTWSNKTAAGATDPSNFGKLVLGK